MQADRIYSQEEDMPSSATAHNGKRRTMNNVDESDVEEREIWKNWIYTLLLFSGHHLYLWNYR